MISSPKYNEKTIRRAEAQKHGCVNSFTIKNDVKVEKTGVKEDEVPTPER